MRVPWWVVAVPLACTPAAVGPAALRLRCEVSDPAGWTRQPSVMPDHHLELLGPGPAGAAWLVVGERAEPSVEEARSALEAWLVGRGLGSSVRAREGGGLVLTAVGPERTEEHHLLPTDPPAWATLSWGAEALGVEAGRAALRELKCRPR